MFSLKLIPTDAFDIMIARFAVQATAFRIFAGFYKRYEILTTNGQPIACALNILMSSSTNLTYVAALYYLPLSDLNTIKYTYIVWAAILSVIFLKDRFKIVNGISLVLTCAGLILATKPHFFIKTLNHIFHSSPVTISNITTTTTLITPTTTSSYYYLGIGLASVSALTRALKIIARKQLVQTKQPHSVMNFHFTISALIVSITYSIIRRHRQPGPYPWKWMGTGGIAMGCCQLLTNILATKGLKRENVQLVSILGSLDIVYAVILQYIFFRQTKSWMFYIGASLVVSSAIVLSVDRYRSNRRERKTKAINDMSISKI